MVSCVILEQSYIGAIEGKKETQKGTEKIGIWTTIKIEIKSIAG